MANIVQYNDWLEEEVRDCHKIANTFYVLEQLVLAGEHVVQGKSVCTLAQKD